MNLIKNTTLLLFTLLIFFSACETSITGSEDNPTGELPRELTTSEKMLIQADQSFSYDIFRRTVAFDSNKENVFISPLSISMAMAMTLNGAEGQTFEDMRNAMSLKGMELEEINRAFQSLMKLLVTVDPKVTLKVANSVWYREDFPVKEEFLERINDFYDGTADDLNFNDPASVDIINNWVNKNTDGLIDQIITHIPDDMVMYLMNALYFKGDWLNQFETDDTRKADFVLETGETVDVDMMHQKGLFATHISDEVHLIELPYGDSLYSMSVLMPSDINTPIDQFAKEKLSFEKLSEWRSELVVDYNGVSINFPKFELDYEIEYNDILKAMGMEIAFNATEADFNGITDRSVMKIYIDEVKHKTFIRVDEEGTEAAAVTSVGIVESVSQQFNINRPFVFIIHELETGTNLFMGKVKNPNL